MQVHPSSTTSSCAVLQLCTQVVGAFIPVGTGLAALLAALVNYLDTLGCTSNGTSARPATDTPEQSRHKHEEYITLQLPGCVFAYIKCLLKLGEAIDKVAVAYDIKRMSAHDCIFQQVRRYMPTP